MLPASVAEARASGSKQYFTGKPCKSGHIAPRLTANSTCLRCMSDTFKRWRDRDPDRAARVLGGTRGRWMEQNPGWAKAAYEKHKDKPEHREAAKRWQDANRDKVRAIKAAWKRRNPEWVRGWARKRAAQVRKATPAWLSEDQLCAIDAIYYDAANRPGGPWHVDHIIPLNGKTVCGLHVPWNLQVLLATENMSKGNQLDIAA